MCSIKASLKLAGVRGLHAFGMSQWSSRALGVKGAILTFHEIHDDLDSELWTGCQTLFFERSLRWLRNNGWDIVAMNDALTRLCDHEEKHRFAVITFDDGYRDNITRALPVLRNEQIPFTMYIPTGAITRELYAWWLGLRELFRCNDKVDLTCVGRSFSCSDLSSKRRGLCIATRWVHADFKRVLDLRHTFSKYGISLASLCDRYFIDEKELKLLANDSLATIGAHTVSHPALATLDRRDVYRELTDNRDYLQDRLNREIRHFAYPYGSPAACGKREAAIALEAGFQTAVTTSHRPLSTQDLLNLHSLPRISVHPQSTIGHLDTELGGLTRASIRNLFSARNAERSG
jgi:peptidoglycan/xylan/chitin deacetylase (PgdA/CDA1 family)